MHEFPIHPVFDSIKQSAHITAEQYKAMYERSINDADNFWAEKAEEFLTWDKKWTKVSESAFSTGEAAWFIGGKLNVSKNCIDRHLLTRANQTALIWEGDDPENDEHITYQDLHDEVCKLSNALKSRGVKKGDRVCIYMPMILEAAYAMLACTRIGAVHSVVFGGFSPEALKDRILDSDCQVIITADEGVRGGKHVPLKNNVDKALANCPNVHTSIVVKRTGGSVNWNAPVDVWYHDLVDDQAAVCAPELMDAEDPLFILYTSGSTGKPKGVLHTTGGYLLQTAMTHKYTFDYQDGEVYWCTADVGWITGHSYILYGPLTNGATSLMFEGVPTYPTASRCWDICDKHNVAIFYTAPTAIRALMGAGDEFVTSTSRKSLRILGTVGEPINPEAWEWYFKIVGESRCPIVDTWWQTETGAHMLAPLPGATALKPGSATFPVFGVEPILLDANNNVIEGEGEGLLMIKRSWPSQIRSVYGDKKRFFETYFASHPGYYFTGDGAKRDADGYYWITGRVDDVLNISGHRMG
ncbi:MAG: acetate--CoA ligase, partial [Sinobacterium sp.]|nr:acetate--CoA ligase [Sinobacterium sp.]